jgi:hypothetical protein
MVASERLGWQPPHHCEHAINARRTGVKVNESSALRRRAAAPGGPVAPRAQNEATNHVSISTHFEINA